MHDGADPSCGDDSTTVASPSDTDEGAFVVNGQVTSRHQARLEAGRNGSCMALWKGADVRTALWAARNPRPCFVPAVPARSVKVSRLTGACLEQLQAESSDRRNARISEVLTRPVRVDPVRDAWVAMVRERMDGRSVCFFTGTYRDDYGYPMGLMKPRNVQRDFRRFLHEQGFDDTEWVCAVEAHRFRDILHLHALLAGVTGEQADALKHAWDMSRGWSTAPPCTDGGMAYTCKYALKAAEGDSFDWSW
jgi:hypothetical protein